MDFPGQHSFNIEDAKLFANSQEKEEIDNDISTRTRSRRTPSKLGKFYEMNEVNNVIGSDGEDHDEDDSDDDPSYDDKEKKMMDADFSEDWAASQYSKSTKRKKPVPTMAKKVQKNFVQQSPSMIQQQSQQMRNFQSPPPMRYATPTSEDQKRSMYTYQMHTPSSMQQPSMQQPSPYSTARPAWSAQPGFPLASQPPKVEDFARNVPMGNKLTSNPLSISDKIPPPGLSGISGNLANYHAAPPTNRYADPFNRPNPVGPSTSGVPGTAGNPGAPDEELTPTQIMQMRIQQLHIQNAILAARHREGAAGPVPGTASNKALTSNPFSVKPKSEYESSLSVADGPKMLPKVENRPGTSFPLSAMSPGGVPGMSTMSAGVPGMATMSSGVPGMSTMSAGVPGISSGVPGISSGVPGMSQLSGLANSSYTRNVPYFNFANFRTPPAQQWTPTSYNEAMRQRMMQQNFPRKFLRKAGTGRRRGPRPSETSIEFHCKTM
eukprot:TRINITY_DN2211_c0_g1_i1.p1 TRINITY_DN2211_c0_g1~~TRINITY_DN2211_c0_g1_i1.p1  ORF type:complete len:492 (+),score=135.87 TRINITY_DN2211_c0_g1_i1:101-1576(+)